MTVYQSQKYKDCCSTKLMLLSTSVPQSFIPNEKNRYKNHLFSIGPTTALLHHFDSFLRIFLMNTHIRGPAALMVIFVRHFFAIQMHFACTENTYKRPLYSSKRSGILKGKNEAICGKIYCSGKNTPIREKSVGQCFKSRNNSILIWLVLLLSTLQYLDPIPFISYFGI